MTTKQTQKAGSDSKAAYKHMAYECEVRREVKANPTNHRHPTLCPIFSCNAKHNDGACDKNNCEEWARDGVCDFCGPYTAEEFHEFLAANAPARRQ